MTKIDHEKRNREDKAKKDSPVVDSSASNQKPGVSGNSSWGGDPAKSAESAQEQVHRARYGRVAERARLEQIQNSRKQRDKKKLEIARAKGERRKLERERLEATYTCRCETCGAGFTNIAAKEAHIVNVHAIHTCKICGKHVEGKRKLKKHGCGAELKRLKGLANTTENGPKAG